MFDKKQKNCIKRIHLVTDDGLYDRKTFYEVELFLFIFYIPSYSKTSWQNETKVSSIVPLLHDCITSDINMTRLWWKGVVKGRCQFSSS